MRPMMPLVFVAMVAMGGAAAAQGTSAAPLQNQPPVSYFGPWLPPAPQCYAEFTRLRQDATARAGQIKAAHERKASSREACELLRGYARAEAELVKVTATCTISAYFEQQLKANHKRTNEMMVRVCRAAGTPIDQPPVPRDQLPFRILQRAEGPAVQPGPPSRS